jgi:hypothetical protein
MRLSFDSIWQESFCGLLHHMSDEFCSGACGILAIYFGLRSKIGVSFVS